jgi:hypothetical protein
MTYKELARYPEGAFRLSESLVGSITLDDAVKAIIMTIRTKGVEVATDFIQDIISNTTKADSLVLINALTSPEKYEPEPIRSYEVHTHSPAKEEFPVLAFPTAYDVIPVYFYEEDGYVNIYTTNGEYLHLPDISKELFKVANGAKGLGHIKVRNPDKFLKEKTKDQSYSATIDFVVEYVYYGTGVIRKDWLILETLFKDIDDGFEHIRLVSAALIKNVYHYERFLGTNKAFKIRTLPFNEKTTEPLVFHIPQYKYVATLQVFDGGLHYRGFNAPTQVALLEEIKDCPDNITSMYLVNVYFKDIEIYGDGIAHLKGPMFFSENIDDVPADSYTELLAKI